MGELYLSDWNPPGYRKSWDRCSMDPRTAATFLGHWATMAGGTLVECVGWFDDDGAARAIAADFTSGKRVVVRCNTNHKTVTFQGIP